MQIQQTIAGIGKSMQQHEAATVQAHTRTPSRAQVLRIIRGSIVKRTSFDITTYAFMFKVLGVHWFSVFSDLFSSIMNELLLIFTRVKLEKGIVLYSEFTSTLIAL